MHWLESNHLVYCLGHQLLHISAFSVVEWSVGRWNGLEITVYAYISMYCASALSAYTTYNLSVSHCTCMAYHM